MSDTQSAEPEVEPIPVVGEHEAAPEFEKPPYMVVGDVFVAQARIVDDETAEARNVEIHIPLSFKSKTIRDAPGYPEPIGEVVWLLEHDPAASRKAPNAEAVGFIDELDYLDAVQVGRKWSQAYRERQGLRLGESKRS